MTIRDGRTKLEIKENRARMIIVGGKKKCTSYNWGQR